MKKNIAIMIPSLRNGGAERAVSNLTKDLIDEYNVYLIVFDASKMTYDYEGTLIDLKLPPLKTKFGKVINVFRRSFKVKKIKKKYKFDCCISFLEGANLVNVLSKYKEKVITSERCLVSFMHNSWFAKKEIQYISKKADKIVSLSKMVGKELIDCFKVNNDKIVTIYNSCDKKRLLKNMSNEIQTEEIFNKDKRYIVTMGRLEYQKGQWHLIKAFKKVTEQIDDVELIILGQGYLKNDLETLAKNLEISNKINFLGYVINPHKILSRCDVFVFSSLAEGLGNVLLEALAFNKAIVSTDCYAGPREILAPNTEIDLKTNEVEMAEYGILVPSFNKEKINTDDLNISKEEEKMAEAIIRILNNRDIQEKYEKKAQERIKDFSPDDIRKEWKKLIEGLLKN